MFITIQKAGLLTSIQDQGRIGYQHIGVTTGGAMDPLAARLANLLVGNSENESVLEMTLIGPTIQFHMDTFIAICGAHLSPTLNTLPLPTGKLLFIRKGSTLSFGKTQVGCRAYLAIAGGFQVSSVLGSKSTHFPAQFGGVAGRACRDGDQIKIGQWSEKQRNMIQVYTRLADSKSTYFRSYFITTPLPKEGSRPILIRIIAGPQYQHFTEMSKQHLRRTPYRVNEQANRMGYRLDGASLSLSTPLEMLSEPVLFGTIQVPPSGQPILLAADAQTVGGYPKIAQVASVDRSLLAQAKPGNWLQFQLVDVQEAQSLLRRQALQYDIMKQALRMKWRQIV
ncbi:biotin-dependent carboxyltransferase [Hazenella sp. IB182357]|uniref:Biotin-dependent carboxyltransferase n=1 Tax=Polycladospora coralii TaxID=2771432 RepID=A0A926N6B3_9BACL|nr:biotin-dependent carboxyltransferase family protein [Polycladospora coralii]MBD1371846.1 biotin-dependent carboxyltransferase [Polycladospora coralii]